MVIDICERILTIIEIIEVNIFSNYNIQIH